MPADQRKIRYAVVGLGHIAQVAVLPAFRNAQENSELTAFVSGDRDKLQQLGDEYGVEKRYHYSEFEEALRRGEVDAVYLATPNDHHRDFAEMVMKYGVHVLCEKPMAVTESDCEAMIAAAEENGTKLMVAYRLHFEAANLRIAELANSRIGTPRFFNSVFTFQVPDPTNIRLQGLEAGGGPLYDIGIYCINAARSIFRAEPIEVFAFTTQLAEPRFQKVSDSLGAVLKFPQDRIANFTVSFGAYQSSDYDVVGTEGRLRLENAYAYATSMSLKTLNGEDTTEVFQPRDQFAPELIYFSSCILEDKEPEPGGLEGLADVRIIEAILRSVDEWRPIQIDPIEKYRYLDSSQVITRPPGPDPLIVKVEGRGGD